MALGAPPVASLGSADPASTLAGRSRRLSPHRL